MSASDSASAAAHRVPPRPVITPGASSAWKSALPAALVSVSSLDPSSGLCVGEVKSRVSKTGPRSCSQALCRRAWPAGCFFARARARLEVGGEPTDVVGVLQIVPLSLLPDGVHPAPVGPEVRMADGHTRSAIPLPLSG